MERRTRRTGVPHSKTILIPKYWSFDRGFNPFKVRPKAAKIARALRQAIRKEEYEPRCAAVYTVPKADGTPRDVAVFQVADNALSRLIYRKLTARNTARLSPRCYAYRRDVSLHDAVFHAASEFRRDIRLFVAEFDIRKFFDTLAHEHILRVLTDGRFLSTRQERQIIQAFLRSRVQGAGPYTASGGTPRERGVPQGTSISLFLANLAGFPLDRALERLGVGFVRFADDTLIWSNDYSELCRGVDALNEAARQMGVDINLQKSEGISLLAEEGERTEFKSKTCIDFLGYSIAKRRISLRASFIERAKDRISYLAYANLLQPLRHGHFVPQRFRPPFDRDYYVMVLQIRRYLYGDLNESRLRRFLAGMVPRMHFKGLLSACPLVDDVALLKELDGWMLQTVHQCLAARSRLLAARGFSRLPLPHSLPPKRLLTFRTRSTSGAPLDLRLPSFVRMGSTLLKAARVHGPSSVARPVRGSGYGY